MNPYQKQVEEFHYATGSTVGDRPAMRDRELRASLIIEEACETVAAMGFNIKAILSDPRGATETGQWVATEFHQEAKRDLPHAIDGLIDLLYVTFGTAVAWGIDLDPFFAEVQRANMSKTTGPKRADGKQLKPEGWQPPDIEGVLSVLTK